MQHKIFITGTDTGVGKTYVCVQLLQFFNKLGYSTLGIKPIASGCDLINQQLYSSDALALQQAASVKVNYELINPIRFLEPIAPHLAAQRIGQRITVTKLDGILEKSLQIPADITLIEGIGGWLVPLNNVETMADWVSYTNFSVILVVGIRLGCLNHALLTTAAIESKKLPFIGWIANCLDPRQLFIQEQIQTLQKQLSPPCLGILGAFEDRRVSRREDLLFAFG